jgi:O-succinylbenzoic acid--CoA ligase
VTFSDWPWRHWRRLRGDAPAVRLNDVVLNWRQLCAKLTRWPRDSALRGHEGEGVLLRAYNQPSHCWHGWRCCSAARGCFR